MDLYVCMKKETPDWERLSFLFVAEENIVIASINNYALHAKGSKSEQYISSLSIKQVSKLFPIFLFCSAITYLIDSLYIQIVYTQSL